MTLTNITNPPFYNVGTISLIQGSDIASGTGTAWLQHLLKYGIVIVHGANTLYHVDEVIDDTQIRLDRAWSGTNLTDVSYHIYSQYGSITDAKLHNFIAVALDRANKSLAVHVFQEHELDASDVPLSTVGNDNDLGFIFDAVGGLVSSWQKIDGAWTNETGLQGAKGDQGDSGTISIGSVSTGAPGSNADVTNTGTPENATLDITIPRGDVGDQGEQGFSVLSGEGIPSSGVGRDGDFYLDLPNNQHLYGPKTSGNWGAPVSFKGSQGGVGPSGAAFVIEAQGPISSRSAYDNEAVGFSFYAIDEDSVYQRNTNTPGTWTGPFALGSLQPIFYGFSVDENYHLILEIPDNEFIADDYDAWVLFPGQTTFTIDNGIMKQSF